MALIKCPECGQEISDKATICPHCGTSIFVCPRCGQVSVGSPTMCPQCGYRNAGQKPVVQPKKAETDIDSEVNTDVIAAWLEANPGERKWFGFVIKALRYLLFLGALGVLLCIVYFIEYPFETLKERGKEVLDMVFNFQTYIRNVWILIALVCVLILAWAILLFYGEIWSVRCGRWLVYKKIDVRESLKNESQKFQNGKLFGYRVIYGYHKYTIQNVDRAYVYDMALRKSGNYMLIADRFVGVMCFFVVILICVLSYAFALCNLIENNAIDALTGSILTSQMQLITEDNMLKIVPFCGMLMGIQMLFFILLSIIEAPMKKRARKTIRQALSK